MIHFHFLTLFPQTIDVWLSTSMMKIARQKQLFEYHLHQLRDFSEDPHRSVDDSAYGGGGGMVLKIEPLVKAVETLKNTFGKLSVVSFSPGGRRLNQALLDGVSETKHFLLVCGHYEGIDQRFIDGWVDLEISIGEFVVSGGELPALCFADSLIRQQDGALGHDEGARNESFRIKDPETQDFLLEYPHYTRPAEFRGMRVPEILLTGNHLKIENWRIAQSRQRTNSP